ncbi:hypothetical protein TNCV_2726851 [Trichonephila clavipes]|nr:hypothetical protein TNCV_2726851 [Trichonephila clavipes]
MDSESSLIEVKFFVFDEPVHKSTVNNPFHELAEGVGVVREIGLHTQFLHSEAFLFGFRIGMTVESFQILANLPVAQERLKISNSSIFATFLKCWTMRPKNNIRTMGFAGIHFSNGSF